MEPTSNLSPKAKQTTVKKEDSDDREDAIIDSKTIASFHSSIATFAFVERSQPQAISNGRAPRSSMRLSGKITKKSNLKGRLKSSEPSTPGPSLTNSSPRGTPTKKPKKVRGYAAPEVYAHLRDLPDILVEDLDVVFCGINPGQKSAEIGHHFGHPTNHFWGCLHESGFTSQRLPPQEDHTLPARFSLGLTNLVDRATAEQNELSLDERSAGVPALLTKVAKYRPRILCYIGLGIAKVVYTKLPLKTQGVKGVKFQEGLQPYKMVHHNSEGASSAPYGETLFYALPSTSGRVIQPQRTGKIEMFKVLRYTLHQLKQGELNTDNLCTIFPPEVSMDLLEV